MRNKLWLDCDTVMNTFLESDRDISMPLSTRLRIDLHLLFCADCAREYKNLKYIEEIMKTDFFPSSPNLDGIFMEKITDEAIIEETADAPTGVSFRSWVIIGLLVLFSLSSAFFGVNFIEIADAEGLSFLLPVGITIGIVVSCYGAFFIGSHLRELSMKFRLR